MRTMYKSEIERRRSKATAIIAVCVISLVLSIKFVTGQVVIVPNKPKTNSKTKAKPKPKTTKSTSSAPARSPAPVPTITPMPTPSRPPDPAPDGATTPSPVITPTPPLSGDVKRADPSSGDVKRAEPEARVAPPINLSEYLVDVITSDERGKITQTRKNRARHFTEKLGDGVVIEMVEAPGGTFSMGTTADELEQIAQDHGRDVEKEMKPRLPERLRWETPQRTVRVSRFYLSKYEITQAQWRAVAQLPKVKRDLMSDPSYFKGGSRPVEMVSWEDAMEFCERLSRATGRKYRLPTEAEWEYACRAGSRSAFHFGDTVTPAWANYDARSPYASAPKGASRQQTMPVGSLGVANAFGLFDMHGNVWEWCLDTWHDNYSQAPNDGSSREKEANNYVKVIRGGAWNSFAGECRAGARNRITAPFKLNGIGFRVVAEAEDKTGD
jgi:formylglycine-generating enzyme required for sulfatase activity